MIMKGFMNEEVEDLEVDNLYHRLQDMDD